MTVAPAAAVALAWVTEADTTFEARVHGAFARLSAEVNATASRGADALRAAYSARVQQAVQALCAAQLRTRAFAAWASAHPAHLPGSAFYRQVQLAIEKWNWLADNWRRLAGVDPAQACVGAAPLAIPIAIGAGVVAVSAAGIAWAIAAVGETVAHVRYMDVVQANPALGMQMAAPGGSRHPAMPDMRNETGLHPLVMGIAAIMGVTFFAWSQR